MEKEVLEKTPPTKKTRLECTFENCACPKYCGKRDSRCDYCGHGDVWHRSVTIVAPSAPPALEKEEDLTDMPQ